MTWDRKRARKTYAIAHWSEGYFDIDSDGHLCVYPKGNESEGKIDLYEVAQNIRQAGLCAPVLVRFTDILRHRVDRLESAFAQSRQTHQYQGQYYPVYPIKVNQQRGVIDGIKNQGAKTVGLEAGSKSELQAIVSFRPRGAVICNGYKDRTYIRLALIAKRLGLDVYIVIEKLSEFQCILDESRLLGISPQLGVRVRLSSIASGKWQNSGGTRSKFGLNPANLLNLVDQIRQAGLSDSLTLMHFHIGSQVSNIGDIKVALKEAGRHYSELRNQGNPISVVDVGGGLGVDYEGTRSRRDFSINYSLDEYAESIVKGFAAVCKEYGLPHPNIMTEAGRAMTAHHAVLITRVCDIESTEKHPSPSARTDQRKRLDAASPRSVLEGYHDALFNLEQARLKYLEGTLNIRELAEADRSFSAICCNIRDCLDRDIRAHRELYDELNEKLADKVFCNFSLFQSMPDVWAIQQVFPIMPLQRLNEEPTQRAVIQDLTCDSDGVINAYVDSQNIEKTLRIHAIENQEDYFIGFFLLGAYQEILGDMHNLFGDTHSVNVELDDTGDYHFIDPVKGDCIGDLLRYIGVDPMLAEQRFNELLSEAELDPAELERYRRDFVSGLNAYSYLEL